MSRHSRVRFHRFRVAAIACAAAIVGAAAVGAIPALAQSSSIGEVQGRVVDQESGLAIAGAQLASPDLGLSAVTGPSGGFNWSRIAVPSDGQAATIEVRAAGYGIWTIRDVPVFPDDTLILEIELGPDPVDIQVPLPRSETPGLEPLEGAFSIQGAGLDQLNEPIPGTIRVRVTGYAYCDTTRPYTVQTVDFKEYVKHVLPNEWVASWPGEALRAGAMAVKMYAWQIVASGGKWPDADVYDSTCDQVYLPSVSYASTNRAVDFTWNWRLTKSGALVRTSYRALYSQCVDAGKVGSCIAQWDTYYHSIGNNGYDKLTWDEMLYRYYVGTLLTPVWNPPGGFSLRFYGNGWGDIDRVKIPIDNPARPADVGAGDFTLEWWMKATLADNLSTAVSCGPYDAWRSGNILLDRDIYGAGDKGDFGVSLSSGRLAFGAAVGATGTTICGATSVADGAWHHVAVTRRASDGRLQIYVDGALDGEGLGPVGDMSYADGRSTTHPDDPFLVLGAEKHDAGAAYPSYNGYVDEMRLSANIRYSGPFTPPTGPYASDPNTVALYHFNEGFGDTLNDVSGASGGPSHGLRSYGGYTNGPEWTDDSPWFVPQPTPTPYPTPAG
ncbi:MAG TPA: LamG-like jellyroll fold domain-containing protein, partial [Anaerolineales bacterium]|nr:LamG-like jellyroll fold domain-containing protein [Anaerolineales bacterium]